MLFAPIAMGPLSKMSMADKLLTQSTTGGEKMLIAYGMVLQQRFTATTQFFFTTEFVSDWFSYIVNLLTFTQSPENSNCLHVLQFASNIDLHTASLTICISDAFCLLCYLLSGSVFLKCFWHVVYF